LKPLQLAVLQMIYASIGEAQRWILASQLTLDLARVRFTGHGVNGKTGAAQQEMLNSFFHLDRVPRGIALIALTWIHEIFSRMRNCIDRPASRSQDGSGLFREVPGAVFDKDVLAFTFPGGYYSLDPLTELKPKMTEVSLSGEKRTLPEDGIYVATDRVSTTDGTGMVRMMIHELAHFVGPRKDTSRAIVDFKDHKLEDRDFAHTTADQAIRIAECYAGFAQEAASHAQL
jgi:hypothetical protein